MRIVHIINIGGIGGAEKLLIQFLPALSNNAALTCILCYKKGNSKPVDEITEALLNQGVEVLKVKYSPYLPLPVRSIQKIIRSKKADIIHAHLSYANFWMALLKTFFGLKVPIITTLHGYQDKYQNKHGLVFKKSAYLSFYYWFTRWILSRMNGYAIISNWLAAYFQDAKLLGKLPRKVIYHGYKVENVLDRFPESNGDADFVPKIAVPGRLIRLKGHAYALEAFQLVLEKHPGSELHIYGEGPFRGEIENIIETRNLKSNVFLHGYVKGILQELRKCNLALIPSLYESFGIVFLDAFAAGLPVVAFDLPAGNEIIRQGETGLLAEPFNSVSLFAQLEKLITDSTTRRRIVQQGLIALNNQYSINRMADEYKDFYKEIIEKNEYPHS